MSKKQNIFNTLEKRHHVLRYKDKNVEDDLLAKLLFKAWKISPSKNNFMPYTVNVLGPGDKKKRLIYDKVVSNHKYYDEKGLRTDTKANPKSLNVFFSIVKLVIIKFIFSSKYFHINRF